ncbi:glycosyltransferase [Paenibacillus sp. NPDC058071]|uniref:glycosyltransferase n=1 Tax=Paenibacillus sp. NPDC058071 TaxID=3346326 RepID=UPI0036DEAC42
MKKVLFLITGFDYAGAENQVVELCKGLKARGDAAMIVSMIEPVAYLDELKRIDVPIRSLGMSKGVPDPRALFRLRHIIKAFKPDIVHSHLVHANIMARVARLIVRMPVLISTAHNINEGGKVRELLYRVTDPLCQLTTNVSQEAVNRYVAIKAAPKHKIRYVPNGIDMNRFEGTGRERADILSELGAGASGNGFIWLAVGRFVPEKDYPAMLGAFRKVLNRYPDSLLLIAGIGPEREAAERISEELGLGGNVRFLGIRTDVPKLMHGADAYVMSSRWEGLPIVLLEAAASGLPIVATDVGGNGEVVRHGANGYLLAPDDEEELSGYMKLMMSQTPEERRAMGLRGQEEIRRNYDMEQINEIWESIYSEQTARKGRPDAYRVSGGVK